jgi:L,D-transpeptidase ErfK/SrfK
LISSAGAGIFPASMIAARGLRPENGGPHFSSNSNGILLMFRIFSWPLALLLPVVFAGCQAVKPPPPPVAVVQEPMATHTFTFDPERDTVVGEVQVTRAHEEDTLPDLARRFNIGYEEIVRANPGVDVWLPHAGTPVVLPTRFVLPDAPYQGVVINLAALRLFYYPPRKPGELQTVITHPIGIGQVGWSTPLGSAKVTGKITKPWWFPPASVRKEHAENGDPLPGRVPPGPDNPLGDYAIKLSWKSYFIHGTNKPYGVGMRASHGCIRMYPEDIALIFHDVPVGTPVTVVNQAAVYGWQGDTLYLQTFPELEDYADKHAARKTAAAPAPGRAAEAEKAPVDSALIGRLMQDPRGVAVPVSSERLTLEQYLAGVRHVHNQLPAAATWNGVE